MIDIKLTGMCEGCPFSDIEVLENWCLGDETSVIAVCKHEAACERAANIKKEADNDD